MNGGKPDAITEEAITWFVRMHSDQRTLTDEDRFAQWLKQDARHAKAYALVERLWRAAGPEIKPRALEKVSHLPSDKPKRSRKVWWTSLAAALVAVVIGLGYVRHASDTIDSGTFATEVGAQRELKLTDGSIVTLNTGSEISVDLSEHQRSIRLVRGEARFQVAKDPARPFVVDAGAAQVRAIGTAFDVRVSDERVAVTLVEGSVEVTPTSEAIDAPAPAILTAGQQISFDLASREHRLQSVDLERVSAWTRQQLVFDSVPLPAAVEEANRYLETPITVEDPSLAEIRVSGVVRAGNLESFVGSLESSFPVQSIERAGRIVLVRRSDSQSE